jgi:hypothetical protein
LIAIASTSGDKAKNFILAHRKLTRSVTGDHLLFHYRRAAFSSMFKSRVGNILAKVPAFRINLNLDGASIVSKSHTHPSHSETSRYTQNENTTGG